MPIRFYCENCKKKIKAPDDSGGKYGSCPYCNHRCYIPRPKLEDEDELRLSPVDEKAETQYEQLMAETHNITLNILQEKQKAEAAGPVGPMDERELTKHIIVYLRQMADGQLSTTQQTVAKILPHREDAVKILDRIAASDPPEPELADIAPPVLNRLVKNLRTRIS